MWRDAFTVAGRDADALVRRPSWHTLAACRGMGAETWHPERGAPVKPLVDVCRACPARTPCLHHAVTLPEVLGVWGGCTARGRRRLRARGEVTTADGDVLMYDAETGDVLVILNEANPPFEAAAKALDERRAPVGQGNAADASQGNLSGVTAAS